MSESFLNCDWGTTRLRLRAVLAGDAEVAAEHRTLDGVATLAQQYTPHEREARYRTVLSEAVDALAEAAAETVADAPILISGMASSSLGWQELPYARLPLGLDGEGFVWRELAPLETSAGRHRVVLISGARNDTDVMRGEETELLGLASLPEGSPAAGALVIKPGTHSKHLRVEAGRLSDFRTFMTGELFDVLSRHSILQHSVAQNAAGNNDLEALRIGVRLGREMPLAAGLFRVRTRQVLDDTDPAANRAFLSGLLIGNELAYLAREPAMVLVLCATEPAGAAYQTALEELGLAQRLVVIPPSDVELLSARGQAVLLRRVLSRR
ncbi:MAG: 2-keto-3-deoxy-galactonokinase [Planctomycetota bacterium]|nr:MAG: 2-keto-3-deoxy-galactonokinase [Planctomycetota bacterium]